MRVDRVGVDRVRVDRVRVAGAALSVLGVVAFVGGLAVIRGHDVPRGSAASRSSSRTHAGTVAEPSASSTPGTAMTTPAPASAVPGAAGVVATPPVTVLNNSTVPGLGARAADGVRTAGFPVGVVGNFRGRIVATTVYYLPGQEAAARRLAARLPVTARVLPRFEGLPGRGLTVVVTRDYPR